MEIVETASMLRDQFFDLLWGEREGYVLIASTTEEARKAKNRALWREKAFLWPEEKSSLLRYIDQEEHGRHVWFTPLLYDNPHRGKDDVSVTDIVWADLEECHPDSITPSAPIVIQSSPGRYQAIWKLDVDEPIPAIQASDFSRRIAEQYKHLGADTSGADLAQLLRVPGTWNYKDDYEQSGTGAPQVGIITLKSIKVPPRIFDALPVVPGIEAEWEDIPAVLDSDDVIKKYPGKLNKQWHEMFTVPPDSDWSKVLWRFMQMSFEAGMDKQEVFSVGVEAACNKFKRDGYKPNLQLWGDVLRAHARYEQLRNQLVKFDRPPIDIPTLYDGDELSGMESFIDRYHAWANSLGDAASEYHRLLGFVALSSILSGNLKIESSFGDIVPNIWGMILADSTLTRKTTAMDHCTDLIESVPGCENIILATDGSMEGIFKAMSQRTSMPSLFKKDEVQGFMASVGKKDYMAGMLEGLAKLYDSRTLKRQLAKEAITVRDPRFLILAGGIKTKMFSMLTSEHVESGFLPRFLFVTAEASLDDFRPLGPRTMDSQGQRAELVAELSSMRDSYCVGRPYSIGGQQLMATPEVTVELDQAAWDRFALLDKTLMIAGHESIEPSLYTPMLARFAMSTLKCAALLAANRQEPKEDRIVVSKSDVARAISHTALWLPYLCELLENIGKTAFEGDAQKIYRFVQKNPGVASGVIMRYYRLSAKEFANIRETLEGRGMIDVRQSGKAKMLFPVGGTE